MFEDLCLYLETELIGCEEIAHDRRNALEDTTPNETAASPPNLFGHGILFSGDPRQIPNTNPPIIFANLLDFNVHFLMSVPHDERLKLLIQNHDELPLSFLYNVGSWLTHLGNTPEIFGCGFPRIFAGKTSLFLRNSRFAESTLQGLIINNNNNQAKFEIGPVSQ